MNTKKLTCVSLLSGLELQFLAANDILPNSSSHPFPMSPETLYTGRLVAKFLMSFTDDKAIFGDSV